jgi:hypothetical protein
MNCRVFVGSLIILLASLLEAQTAHSNKIAHLELKRNQAFAKGHVGGESHDQYSIFLTKGADVRIQLRSPENAAEFLFSTGPSFRGAEQVRFGVADENIRSWTGTIPASRKYYIYVTAYPESEYQLSVTSR